MNYASVRRPAKSSRFTEFRRVVYWESVNVLDMALREGRRECWFARCNGV